MYEFEDSRDQRWDPISHELWFCYWHTVTTARQFEKYQYFVWFGMTWFCKSKHCTRVLIMFILRLTNARQYKVYITSTFIGCQRLDNGMAVQPIESCFCDLSGSIPSFIYVRGSSEVLPLACLRSRIAIEKFVTLDRTNEPHRKHSRSCHFAGTFWLLRFLNGWPFRTRHVNEVRKQRIL